MNHRKLIIRLLLAVSVFTLAGFIVADNYPIQKIALQLNKWVLKNPVEKVYLQLDKPYYAVGDDIWFKAYVTLGSQHQLTTLSGVLNVELIDDKDSVKQHIKLPLIDGLTWGDFALPDTLTEGNYRIRAYTNWMRNAGPEYFFDQHISIVNTIDNKVNARVAYTFANQNGQQKVNATINYTDPEGVAYANKEVKYNIDLGPKQVAKGKGITDDKGNISLSFTNTLKEPVSSGRIITNIQIDKNSLVTKMLPVKATSGNVDVQFFPEGGSLVTGVTSKIAFKAVGADGLGTDIKGTITDDAGNAVATFSSQHLGMGEFTLNPQANKIYKAHIFYADGSDNTIALPQAIDKGYVLAIDNKDSSKISIKITSNRQTYDSDPNDTLSLIAQCDGDVYYAAKSNPGVSSFVATLDKSRFPSGIVQFTLFSSKGEPLDERLVFIQNNDQLKLDVKAEKTYAPGQKVKIQLSALTSDAKPAIGSFSVAVTDETKVPQDENFASTILTNLLLTSDLRGYVEQPNYYFNNVSEKTQADMDVLMLTQGYHRFEWKKVLNDDLPEAVYQPEKTLRISGHITTLSGKPVANGKVTLFSTGHGTFFTDTLTDANGRFAFNNLTFPDSIKFVIQARTGKDRRNVNIVLDDVIPQDATHDKNAADVQVNIYDGLSNYVQSSKDLFNQQLKYGLAKHTIVLQEVVITDKRIRLKNSSNLNGPGNADQVLVGDQIPLGCFSLDQCLQGVLFGVVFRNGVPYSTRGGMMTVNLDGVFISSDEFNIVNMNDIGSIEVLRTGVYMSIYGSQAGPGGVIVLTSKTGDELNKARYNEPIPGIVAYTPIGYSKIRMFYSPQYDDPKTNQAVADQRSTIYWNSNIATDKSGNASFEYFNAGSKGNYRVIIEGIDAYGNLARQVYRYKVQ
ncbi:carboxypeptidase regulatory-like domain-containing protein [Mucilaginibacter sp. L196]|uniref:carboxypeptidase regulatory-like domain-containing protein n=1 Tax=Mucilaginibacter sp. L196 TaxID=1641870 RepID=UPI00131C5C1B|nr:carboxypeptidase regulatory-like domain-containing protein [Mucilaginibacter sp. L196]